MTTGHAPDDWLDIPPPPFAPGDDEPAPDAEDHPADSNGDGELPAAELPTGELPAAEDAPELSLTLTGQFRAVAAELAADLAATSGTDVVAEAATGELPAVDIPDAGAAGVTLTGQFRAVAAELAADLAATSGTTSAGNGSGVGTAGGSDAGTDRSDEGRAASSATGAGAASTSGDGGEVGSSGAAASDAAGAGRAGSSGRAGGVAERPEVGGATGDAGGAVATDGPSTPDDEADGSDEVDLVKEAGGIATAGGATVTPVDETDGSDEVGLAGGASGVAVAAVDGAEEGRGVDVAGAAEVPEPPPTQKAWRVPVLRARRDPDKPPPPDAVPADRTEAVAEVGTGVGEVEAGAQVGEVAGDAVAIGAGRDGGAEMPVRTGGELGPRARRRIEAHRHRTVKLRRQRRLAVAGLALLVTGGAALGMVGVAKVRGSTGGRYVDPQIRPDEPGYVALVTPTPTLLVVHKDAAGALSGVSLLSLHAQDEGGSVIVMPVTTVAPFAPAGTTFADAYAENGAEGVATQVELTLNISIGETVEVDDARWATLVGPVAPITLDLDTPVGEWPAGEAEIPADRIGEFLTTRTDSETELARLDRQELFWEMWLPLVKDGGRNAVPGEVDVGLGRFVRGLAAGDTDVTVLPVSAAFSVEEMYGPTEEMLPDLVAQAVPYPQEPSRGSRVQIQLLNGTTQRDLTARAATSLVAGGAEISLVGNAATFAEPTTRFVYATAKLRDDAEKLRDAFGVGEVVQAPPDEDAPPVDEDRIDVTVILGADALDALGG